MKAGEWIGAEAERTLDVLRRKLNENAATRGIRLEPGDIALALIEATIRYIESKEAPPPEAKCTTE